MRKSRGAWIAGVAAVAGAAGIPRPSDLSLAWTPSGGPCIPDTAERQDRKGEEPSGSTKEVPPDWAGLGRYREENARIGAPRPGENRVVFFGDSITEGWILSKPGFFEDRSYIARGISGQTTGQMLVRFRQDVIALEPKVVVILAGTNDIAGNAGPYRQDATMDNLASMIELAQVHRIAVVLASVLPARHYPWNPDILPAPEILSLNALLRNHAARKGIIYLDYYAAMADGDAGLKASLSEDGVHPNSDGFEVMCPLAEKSVRKALGGKKLAHRKVGTNADTRRRALR